jgi:outer membrane protein assembly factor BamA
VGSCSYTQRNLFGLGQRLNASVELGQLENNFRVQHLDPWVNSDALR